MLEYIKKLDEHEATCLLYVEDHLLHKSTDKGVKPLLDYLFKYEVHPENLMIIDRIMGKGAICLALKLKAVKVYTPIISEMALALANQYNLDIQYEKVVAYIINREGNGQCPIEKSLAECNDIDEGVEIIVKTLEALRKGN